MKKYYFFILLCVTFNFSCSSLAHANNLIYNCNVKSKVIKNKSLILNSSKPKVYLLHNVSKQTLFLHHDNNGRGVGAGWDSVLSPNHWSALALNKKQFSLTCNLMQKGQQQAGQCRYLKVCQLKHPAKQIENSYWIVENEAWGEFKGQLREKGFE